MVMPASSESVLFHSVITTLFFLCRYFYKENNQVQYILSTDLFDTLQCVKCTYAYYVRVLHGTSF